MGPLSLSVTGGWRRCVEEGEEPVSENHCDEVLMVRQHMRKPHATNEHEEAVPPAPPQRDIVNGGEDHIANESSGVEMHRVC